MLVGPVSTATRVDHNLNIVAVNAGLVDQADVLGSAVVAGEKPARGLPVCGGGLWQ